MVKEMAKEKSVDGRRKLKLLCGAWHGVGLNEGIISATCCHQNWIDDKWLFNCVAPFGDRFRDGDLVLWQMRIGIVLEIGDWFFFYRSMVAYKVMEVTEAIRNLIDLFTHASNFALLAKHVEVVSRVKKDIRLKKRRCMIRRERNKGAW